MISTSAVLLRRLTLFDDTLKNLRSGLDKGPIILDKVSKNGEVKKGIYDNTELIRDAEEFGCNLAKYSEAFRSQNQSFIGKRSKKASEYKPMLSERIEE